MAGGYQATHVRDGRHCERSGSVAGEETHLKDWIPRPLSSHGCTELFSNDIVSGCSGSPLATEISEGGRLRKQAPWPYGHSSFTKAHQRRTRENWRGWGATPDSKCLWGKCRRPVFLTVWAGDKTVPSNAMAPSPHPILVGLPKAVGSVLVLRPPRRRPGKWTNGIAQESKPPSRLRGLGEILEI